MLSCLADVKYLSYSVGKTKCMSKTGDCVVKHGTNFTTGLGMVVSANMFVYIAILHNDNKL